MGHVFDSLFCPVPSPPRDQFWLLKLCPLKWTSLDLLCGSWLAVYIGCCSHLALVLCLHIPEPMQESSLQALWQDLGIETLELIQCLILPLPSASLLQHIRYAHPTYARSLRTLSRALTMPGCFRFRENGRRWRMVGAREWYALVNGRHWRIVGAGECRRGMFGTIWNIFRLQKTPILGS